MKKEEVRRLFSRSSFFSCQRRSRRFQFLAVDPAAADPSLRDSVITDWPSRCPQWRIYRYTDHVNVESMPSSRSCAPRGSHVTFLNVTTPAAAAIRRPGSGNMPLQSVKSSWVSQTTWLLPARTEPPPPPPRSPSPPPPPPRPSAGCFIIKPLPRPPADAAGWSPGDSTFGSRGGSGRRGHRGPTAALEPATLTPLMARPSSVDVGHTDWLISIKIRPPPPPPPPPPFLKKLINLKSTSGMTSTGWAFRSEHILKRLKGGMPRIWQYKTA